MDSEVIIFIIFGIAITVGLFFLFRLITCWYFKINKRVSLLEQQVNLLSEIISSLVLLWAPTSIKTILSLVP